MVCFNVINLCIGRENTGVHVVVVAHAVVST